MILMFAKLHKRGNLIILAACDEELLGKKLKGEKISIKISENFYKGNKVNEAELIELLNEADSSNLIGKKVVEVALKAGFAVEKNCIYFGKIPHLQIFKV